MRCAGTPRWCEARIGSTPRCGRCAGRSGSHCCCRCTLLVARPARRLWLPLGVLLAALVVIGGRSGHQSLLYLPIFGFGVLLGVNLDAGRRLAARASRAHWWLLLVLSLAALDARWIRVITTSPYAFMLSALGAAGVVAIVAYSPWAGSLGRSRTLRSLGRCPSASTSFTSPSSSAWLSCPCPGPPRRWWWACLWRCWRPLPSTAGSSGRHSVSRSGWAEPA